MEAYRFLGALGFALSFLILLLLATLVGGVLALYVYPASVALRGVAWLLLYRASGRRLYAATGVAVAGLGLLMWAAIYVNVSVFVSAARRGVTADPDPLGRLHGARASLLLDPSQL